MVTGILKKIIPIAIAGLGIFAVANIVARPQMAQQSATALSSTLGAFGTGLGSIGQGASQFLGGVGSGSAKLLDPLFSLKTLVYGDSAQAVLQEQSITASNTSVLDPVVNSASDQPGVTPSAPAGATFAFPDGSIAEPGGTSSWDVNQGRYAYVNPDGKTAFPKSRVATSQEKSLLSSLTGGLLG
jgi:hypothetical protein|tara:strand:- start:113 stop:667 length:555 start_codon:yes stop_codon:yes gene_type:complete